MALSLLHVAFTHRTGRKFVTSDFIIADTDYIVCHKQEISTQLTIKYSQNLVGTKLCCV